MKNVSTCLMGLGAVAMMTAPTMADVASDVISVASANTAVPVVFEDDNLSLLISSNGVPITDPAAIQVGDAVVGAISIQAITRGDRPVTGGPGQSITDVNPNTPSVGQAEGGLIGLLNAEIANITPGVGGSTILTLTDRSGAATNFIDPGGGPNITVGGFANDVMIELYEDSTPEAFNRADISDLFSNITDGTMIAELGGDDVNPAVFYTVVVNALGLVDRFEVSLDFVSQSFLPGVAANDIGTELYGTGQATGIGAEGGVVGDADFAILIPEPASLALLGLGGLALIRRR